MSSDFEDDLPEDQPLFTAKELADIKAKAKAEVLAAKKDAIRKKLMEDEKHRLRLEDGLTTGSSHMDEIVTLQIDLPSFAPFICINGGVKYYHASTVTVPRHVATTLQDTMYCAWRHESEIHGDKLKEFYAKQHVNDLYKVGSKARNVISAQGV